MSSGGFLEGTYAKSCEVGISETGCADSQLTKMPFIELGRGSEKDENGKKRKEKSCSGHSLEKQRSGVGVVTWPAVAPCVRPLSE